MKISMTSIYNWYRNTLRNPKYRWWIVLGTLVYLISPFDIAPDFIPFIGEIDDVMLATLLVTEVSQLFLEKFKSRQQNTPDSNAVDNSTVEVEAETVVSEKA
jgi:uncharacterized membrane protein YkvA (DUF1232 family)